MSQFIFIYLILIKSSNYDTKLLGFSCRLGTPESIYTTATSG